MSKQTINGFIVHQTWAGGTKGHFVFQESKARTNEYVTQLEVCPLDISFDVPDDFDPRPAQVEALRKQKDELRAKFSAAVKELDDRINSLLALEMAE